MRRLILTIAMAAVFACTARCPIAQADDTHVGWIEKIDGNCSAQLRGKESPESKSLDPSKDHYRFLYPGESVRCTGSGSMVLQILDDAPKKITKQNGWCEVHNEAAVCEKKDDGAGVSRAAEPRTKIRTVDERALIAFGRPAGRQRGLHSAIYAPAAESTVRAGELVVRWNAIPGATKIALRLTDKYHSVLWEQEGVAAGDGRLASPAIGQALIAYRDKGGAGPFRLTLEENGMEQPAVEFSILTADEEKSLDKDLAGCERTKGLLRAVCRTYAFAHREMWNDAAGEHEAALKLAPDSVDLTLAALAAENGVGNTERAMELRAKLPPGTTVP